MNRTDESLFHPVSEDPERDPSMAGNPNSEWRSCPDPQAALRSLFHSRKYNFQDGLDDYCLRDPECGSGRG